MLKLGSVGFHGPMYALINLFIHVLQKPGNPTAQSDLTLMEIGAAHFLRLEFATASEISFPFVKELVNMAQLAMANSKRLPLPESPRTILGDLNRPPGVPPGPDMATMEPDHTLGASGNLFKDESVSICSSSAHKLTYKI